MDRVSLGRRYIPLGLGEVDLLGQVLRTRQGERVTLTPGDVALLEVVAARPHEDLPRDELAGHLQTSGDLSRALDAAVHRLRLRVERDPVRPESLLTVRGKGYRFVPATPVRPAVGRPVHRLYGRDAEVERLLAALETTRLVTLTGPPGIGKTRLASEVAWRVCADREVVQVDLSTTTAPVEAVAARLGVQGDARDLSSRLGVALAARGPALLVLDNAEHVHSRLARHVASWLAEAPRLACVVTSQVPLGQPPEQVLALGPLDGEAGRRLFAEHARQEGLEPSEADAVWVDRIVARLDGLPLAIELAAARSHVLGPKQLHARLEDRFRLLRARRGAPPHHATLRAALDHAWELLDEPLRGVFCQLSVFAGSFPTSRAAAVVAGHPGVADALEALERRSLVVREGPRWRLLQSIRAHAAEQLRARGGGEGVRRRHAEACYEVMLAMGTGALQGRVPVELYGDAADLMAALREMVRIDPDRVGRFAYQVSRVLLAAGSLSTVDAVLDELLGAQALSLQTRLQIRNLRGGNRAMQGDFDGSLDDFQAVIEAARAHGLRKEEAHARGNLGVALNNLRQFSRAEHHLREALALKRALGGEVAVRYALTELANCLMMRAHDEPAARALYEEALELNTAAGDHLGRGVCIMGLAAMDARGGQLERGLTGMRDAVALFTAFGQSRSTAYAVANLSEIELYCGESVAAAERLDEVVAQFRRIGAHSQLARAQALRALAALCHDDVPQARACLQDATRLATAVGHGPYMGLASFVRGVERWRAGERAQARRLMAEVVVDDNQEPEPLLAASGARVLLSDGPERAAARAALEARLAGSPHGDLMGLVVNVVEGAPIPRAVEAARAGPGGNLLPMRLMALVLEISARAS